MKLCLCCKNTADDAAPTCLACGEASFGASDSAPKDEGGEAPGQYDGLTKAQLLELAKERGIEGASSLNKTKLLEVLLAADSAPKDEGGAGETSETDGEGASE